MTTKKILVVTDSHKDIDTLQKAIENEKNTDILIHLGDHIRDLNDVTIPPSIEIYSVPGNCDFPMGEFTENEINVNGVKIFFCHGHTYHVKSYLDYLKDRAVELGSNVVLFGHTHVTHSENCRGILYLNPGALNRYRCLDRPGYIVLSIDDNAQATFIQKYIDV